MSQLSLIKKLGDRNLEKTFEMLKNNNVTLVMSAFYPQRGSILNEYAKQGGKAIISGGLEGQQIFPYVTQYGLEYETTGIEETPYRLQEIVSALPKNIQGNVGLCVEAPLGDNLWSKNLQSHLGGVNLVGSNEQNLRSYFEEKMNLVSILQKSGLQKYIIPQTIISEPQSKESLQDIYEQFKSKDGKVVVQNCGPGVNESGGGYSTIIVSSYDDFATLFEGEMQGAKKVATYIDGCNSNLSFCAGNLLPSKTGLGAVKGELTEDDDLYSEETIDTLLQRGQELGLDESNTFSLVVPSTLKVVGDKNLSHSVTSGVGNIINYHFPSEISSQIYEIGSKLGNLMALCGKVGLAGVDLIITKNGQVFINEINDRQQGTTETTSINCENNDVPGLLHVAFLQNFCDMNDYSNYLYMKQIKDNAPQIYEHMGKEEVGSPFYIKLLGKHEGTYSTIDLSSGAYVVEKQEEGRYVWQLDEKLDEECGIESGYPLIDLNSQYNTAVLEGIDLSEGQFIPMSTQIGRICGEAQSGSEPFIINENGNSVVNPEWLPIIKALEQQTTCVLSHTSLNLDESIAYSDPQDFGQNQ